MMFEIDYENPVNDLLSMVDNEYTYHLSILNALERCVNSDLESEVILNCANGLHVRIERDDWALAIAMCERYFNQKADDTLRDRLSTIKEKIRCYIEGSNVLKMEY